MKQLALITASLSAAILSGCGGGGGSSSSDTGANTGQPPAQTINIQAYSYNSCGITSPATDALVVFHAQNGSIINVANADSAGKIEAEVPSGTHHLSTINWRTNSNGQTQPDIASYLNSTAEGLTTIYGRDDSNSQNCGCKSIYIDTASLSSQNGGTNITVNGTTDPSHFHEAQWCHGETGTYSLEVIAKDLPQPRAAIIEVNIADYRGGDIYTFDAATLDGEQNLSQPFSFLGLGDADSFASFAETNSGRVLWNSMSTLYDLHFFPGLYPNNFGGYFAFDDLTEYGRYSSHERNRIDSANNVQLSYRSDAIGFQQYAAQLLLSVAEGNTGISYNFAPYNNNDSEVIFSVFGENNLYIDIYGPLQGTIPDLRFPNEVEQKVGQSEVYGLSIMTFGYGSQMDSSSHQKSRLTLDNQEGVRNPFFDNYHYQRLAISQ